MKPRNAPRGAVPVENERACTAESAGPMQGVHPMPNSTPSSGAPARPAFGMTDGLMTRPANMNRSNAPKNSRPSRTVTPPRTWVIPAECDRNSSPIPPTVKPMNENTRENPRTNSAVPATIRPGGALAAGVRARHAGDVGQVPGHQRQAARRQKGHCAGCGGHRQGEQQRPGQDQARDAHRASAPAGTPDGVGMTPSMADALVRVRLGQ